MSDAVSTPEVAAVEAPVAAKKAAAKKAVAKKAVAKKAAVKKAAAKKVAAKKVAAKVSTKKAGRPAGGSLWSNPKRKAVLLTLRKMGANSPVTAKNKLEVAGRCSAITDHDVFAYCYKDNELVTEGYVKQHKNEGTRLISYYLTAKGMSVNVDE